ncbi:MAG: efflux RND transporter periplasmic adaptor subunit [Synergistaceae bacterium]|nr:efflux RND transporter periplasmic adaptor subunit [Synergistaceae bacterium]
MKHIIKFLLGVAVIIGVYYGLDTFREEQVQEPEPEIIRPVRVITLRGSGENFTRHYFGTVQGGRRADLSFKVSGTLNQINYEKGASVKKGALLASLDPTDFNTALKQAQSSLSQAQAQHKNAQTDFKRYENLYRQRAISRAQYDSVKTALDVAKSSVDLANAGVKSARDALSYTKLTAPFEGVITDRKAERSQNISAGQVIFNIQDFSNFEIVFNIPDNDILLAPVPNVRNLRELKAHADLFDIRARFEAMPEREFKLSVKEIAAQPTSANTYPVTAIMPPQGDLRILPGMAVTVEVDFSAGRKSQSNKYSVPVSAVLNEKNKNYVWKYNNGVAEKIQVTAGVINNDALIEIEGEKLHDGDIIITAGVYFLHEGQKVKLLKE